MNDADRLAETTLDLLTIVLAHGVSPDDPVVVRARELVREVKAAPPIAAPGPMLGGFRAVDPGEWRGRNR
jgi:hypothetical protein